MVYHATLPTPALSIGACGFAGGIGAGCEEMQRLWRCMPLGTYQARDPTECLGLYPHSVATEGTKKQPGEFFTVDGTFPFCVHFNHSERDTAMAQEQKKRS